MLAIDRSHAYEIIEQLPVRGKYSISRIYELTLESPGYLHQVPLRPGDTREALSSQFEAIILPFAGIHHGRIPLLADAWFGENSFDIALLIPQITPLDPAAANPLRGMDEKSQLTGLLDMLDCLAALHETEIFHGHLLLQDFGVDRHGYIYLHNPGLASRIVDSLGGGEDSDSNFKLRLSTNMKMRDVAMWAYAMVLLLFGKAFEAEAHERWDETDLARAKKELLRVLGTRSPLVEFFEKCLRGATFEANGYDSALPAYADLEKIVRSGGHL
ncbi:MAG: hypothetical protein SF028_00620 [Candidatus Sumerlaeia bacterium]|nr:hypothetical protein [Candidatus Sumerlaeia bacterium]